ncbi:hypothetical protein [Capnocytophaga cynodegmi]|uniref:hypothetical protein n=3 Tax=Capnocytophaga cynodegmi TaxID=28189 RepID=UPI00385933F3
MNVIKSKISINKYLWGIIGIILIIFILYQYIIKSIIELIREKGDSSYFFIIFFILFEVFLIMVHKDFKYMMINTEKRKLKSYSFLFPFGKTIFLDEYIGKITIQETGSSGSYEVVYLVNKQNKTAFKIMGLHYKNFDEMKKAIALPEIKKHLSAKEYFQLLFTGVLDLSKVQNKKSSEFSINKFLGIFITIALIVFLIGMLIKVFTKFMS